MQSTDDFSSRVNLQDDSIGTQALFFVVPRIICECCPRLTIVTQVSKEDVVARLVNLFEKIDDCCAFASGQTSTTGAFLIVCLDDHGNVRLWTLPF